jgi:hypothetical protein
MKIKYLFLNCFSSFYFPSLCLLRVCWSICNLMLSVNDKKKSRNRNVLKTKIKGLCSIYENIHILVSMFGETGSVWELKNASCIFFKLKFQNFFQENGDFSVLDCNSRKFSPYRIFRLIRTVHQFFSRHFLSGLHFFFFCSYASNEFPDLSISIS